MIPMRAKPQSLFLALAILLATDRAPGAAAEPPGTRIELRVPPAAVVGENLTLEARLGGPGGEPIAGALVGFYSVVEFAGVSGKVKLGEALTDEGGVTTLSYVPRQEGKATLVARFSGSQEYGAGQAVATLSLRPGPPLYQETPWVRLPNIVTVLMPRWVLTTLTPVHDWVRAPGIATLLMGLLGAVWAIYLTVMVLLVLIANEGRVATRVERQRR